MLQIPANDVFARRMRCNTLVKELTRHVVGPQKYCNVCGSDQSAVFAEMDRYGLPIRTAMCLHCGLIYLSDRLTAEGYSEFYATGMYRNLTSAFVGFDPNTQTIQRDQMAYATDLVRSLAGYVESMGGGGSLLDVGGSAGLVAREVGERFGLQPTVLDPAIDEIETARLAGLNGVVGSLETFETNKKYNLILLCRSIEHLFDLRGSLLKMRDLLADQGLLYIDIIDFVECCRLRGTSQLVTKLDHCYWLCQETAPRLFQSLGLEVVSANTAANPECIGYLLRRCEPKEAMASMDPMLHQILRRLREIDSDWRERASMPHGKMQQLRLAAYRLKRQGVRLIEALWRKSRSGPPVPSANHSSSYAHQINSRKSTIHTCANG